MRAYDDLQGKVGEQCAVENLAAQALVGIVVAQRAKEGTRVQMRADGRVKVERHEIAVGVLGSQVSHDPRASGTNLSCPITMVLSWARNQSGTGRLSRSSFMVAMIGRSSLASLRIAHGYIISSMERGRRDVRCLPGKVGFGMDCIGHGS